MDNYALPTACRISNIVVKVEPSMADFYHMSEAPLAIDLEVPGNGKDKIDPRIESELEIRRRPSMLSRRLAVYARAVPDFSRCGVINLGYIHRVRLNGTPERRDLNWLRPMQMALFKEKYISMHQGIRAYPDWTLDLVEQCCVGYWSSSESDSPVWESLAPSFTVMEVLSTRPIDVKETEGGWSPAAPGHP